MTMAEPSPGPTTAAPAARLFQAFVRLLVSVFALATTCVLASPTYAQTYAQGVRGPQGPRDQTPAIDPNQPYLQPPPGKAPPPQRPPSAGLLPDSAAPAPDADRMGTDMREETMVEPGDEPDSMPPYPQGGAPAAGSPALSPRPAPASSAVAAGFRPPPRPRPEREPSGRSALVLPAFSLRADPLEILVEGQLGLQFEVRIAQGLSLEFVPIFLLSSTPLAWDLLAFNFRNDRVSQHSNGIGPLAGAAIGVGIWFGGRPFHGPVLRLQLTNYGIEYQSKLGDTVIDSAVFTERRLGLSFGRAYRLGPIIFELSAGLRYELNGAERCDLMRQGGGFRASDSDCDGTFLIATQSGGGGGAVELFRGMGPFALTGRLAIGFVIE